MNVPPVQQNGWLGNLILLSGGLVFEIFVQRAGTRTLHKPPLPKAVGLVKIMRIQYLNMPLETVLHPVSTEVQKVVREEQVAADKALEQIENVQELAKQTEEKLLHPRARPIPKQNAPTPVVIPQKHKKREKSLEENFEQKPELQSNSVASTIPPAIGDTKGYVPKKAISWRLGVGTAGAILVLLYISVVLFLKAKGTVQPTFPTLSGERIQETAISMANALLTETAIPATPTLGIDSTMIGKDGMTLLYVLAGEFTMGSDILGDDEKPVHTVYLDAFWIDKTEVTNAMYSECVSDGVCNNPQKGGSNTRNFYFRDRPFDNYPMVHVTWYDAQLYCSWVNRRLPTEAEWEKAASWDAKNQTKYEYPWGNDAPNKNLLNYDNSMGDTTEIGTYLNGASPYGALDMAGNVWEWVSSLYKSYPYSVTDGREDLNASGERVFRGGAWHNDAISVYSTYRAWDDPLLTDSDLGFRCAMSATP